MIGMSGENWRHKSTLSPISGSQDYIGILIILPSTLFIFKIYFYIYFILFYKFIYVFYFNYFILYF